MALVEYSVQNMRVVRPSGKVAENNPDRALTIHGKFSQIVRDPKGAIARKVPLTITVKAVTVEEIRDPGFSLDPINGTLTLPQGERGRKAAVGMSAEDVLSYLSALREETDSAE